MQMRISEGEGMTMQVSELSALLTQAPFIKFLGIEVVSWDSANQQLTLSLRCRAEFERAAGSAQVHGGVLACFLDTSATLAVIAGLGRPAPTVDLRIDYLRPASGIRLTSVASVRKLGGKLATADAECFDEAGRTLALCRGTFLV